MKWSREQPRFLDYDPEDSWPQFKLLKAARGDVQAAQAYIREIQGQLNLGHWDVFIAASRASDGVNASIHLTPGRYVAAVKLSRGWFKKAPEDQRLDVVHELLHLIHHQLAESFRIGVGGSGSLSSKTWRATYFVFHNDLELMVDHLSTAIAPRFPLPPAFQAHTKAEKKKAKK